MFLSCFRIGLFVNSCDVVVCVGDLPLGLFFIADLAEEFDEGENGKITSVATFR